jgi:transcriptional regulator with XRE-family HTH domain
LTQEQLAERSDLSCDAIRRIENGRLSPTLASLTKLAAGLELELSTLFAAIERPRRGLTAEVADYLSRRTPKECELAWRVLRALFDDGHGPRSE